nr:MAG TPA: hypothetical protein [Caudoviricetes sp.]DAT63071.1 MAG TPA: hypothetical protein [Caudoviricetes sp.]
MRSCSNSSIRAFSSLPLFIRALVLMTIQR